MIIAAADAIGGRMRSEADATGGRMRCEADAIGGGPGTLIAGGARPLPRPPNRLPGRE